MNKLLLIILNILPFYLVKVITRRYGKYFFSMDELSECQVYYRVGDTKAPQFGPDVLIRRPIINI